MQMPAPNSKTPSRADPRITGRTISNTLTDEAGAGAGDGEGPMKGQSAIAISCGKLRVVFEGKIETIVLTFSLVKVPLPSSIM